MYKIYVRARDQNENGFVFMVSKTRARVGRVRKTSSFYFTNDRTFIPRDLRGRPHYYVKRKAGRAYHSTTTPDRDFSRVTTSSRPPKRRRAAVLLLHFLVLFYFFYTPC